MKRQWLMALLAAVMVITFAACETRAPRDAQQTENEGSERQEADETPSDADEAPSEEPEEEAPDLEGAQLEAEKLLEAIQSGDRARIDAQIDFAATFQLPEGQTDAYLLHLLRRMNYEMDGVEAGPSGAVVRVKLTNVAMVEILVDYNRSAMELGYNNALAESPLSEAEMEAAYQNLFAQFLDQNSDRTMTRTVELAMVYEDGGWRAAPDEAFGEAALGDYWSASAAARSQATG